MESLDNTIKGIEHCINTDVTCDKCVYNKKHTRQCKKDNDALYHLKRYRSLLKMWNDKLDKEQQNKPLTWEELKTMEGESVWIELLYHHPEQKYEYCDIIERFDDIEGYELIDLTKTGYLYKSLLGREWKAYRRGKK